jgi:hypothetical protein
MQYVITILTSWIFWWAIIQNKQFRRNNFPYLECGVSVAGPHSISQAVGHIGEVQHGTRNSIKLVERNRPNSSHIFIDNWRVIISFLRILEFKRHLSEKLKWLYDSTICPGAANVGLREEQGDIIGPRSIMRSFKRQTSILPKFLTSSSPHFNETWSSIGGGEIFD